MNEQSFASWLRRNNFKQTPLARVLGIPGNTPGHFLHGDKLITKAFILALNYIEEFGPEEKLLTINQVKKVLRVMKISPTEMASKLQIKVEVFDSWLDGKAPLKPYASMAIRYYAYQQNHPDIDLEEFIK